MVSLMILPKEIKSLKAQVYKLETIINVITPKTNATNVKHKVNTTGTKDKVESVGKQCDLGDKCWSDQDGDFFTYIGSPNQTSNKDTVNDLVDAFDDLVDADDCVKAEKQEVEQRRLRFQLMLEEENSMKSIDHSNSTHMKLALEKCGTTKRTYVNVLRTPIEVDTEIKGPSMDTLKNQKNVAYMKSTLIFGYGTCGILDNPIQIDEIYPFAWRDVEQVFILINEPNRHWSLAQFHIKSGNVTFYDSQETFDVEIRPWYVKIRRCLESKLPVVL
ncbi:phospholipase-like protein [Tanacetum coccineum]